MLHVMHGCQHSNCEVCNRKCLYFSVLTPCIQAAAHDVKRLMLEFICHHLVYAATACTTGVSEQWDANLNRVSAAINSSCSAEVDTRLTAALDSQKQRYEVLQQQLNRLREEKADVRLLTQHIKQVGVLVAIQHGMLTPVQPSTGLLLRMLNLWNEKTVSTCTNA